MLTIYFEDSSSQVLRNFHESILAMSASERNKLLKDIVSDIAQNRKCSYKWENLN